MKIINSRSIFRDFIDLRKISEYNLIVRRKSHDYKGKVSETDQTVLRQ